MTTRHGHEKNAGLSHEVRQICARGWQDYQMEMRHFLGQQRVNKCLRGMSERQLAGLGLSASERRRLRHG